MTSCDLGDGPAWPLARRALHQSRSWRPFTFSRSFSTTVEQPKTSFVSAPSSLVGVLSMTLAWLTRWVPRIVLAVVFFFIAVDIAPEVDEIAQDALERQVALNDALPGRYLSSVQESFVNRSLRITEAPIDGSNWWEACGPKMHRCPGPPETERYCCCEEGYVYDSTVCKRRSSTHLHRGHLLFCGAFDSEGPEFSGETDNAWSPTYSEVQRFDEGSVIRWVSQLLKAASFEQRNMEEVTNALESHHVDGLALLKLTRSKLDAEWNLMNIGLPQNAAEVLAHDLNALKPHQLRRLSTGTSGCDSDTGSTSGTSGCDSDTDGSKRSYKDRSHGQALQGCSKSSTGTRGCDSGTSSTSTGAKGCQSQSSGAKGCHGHAAKGCHGHATRGCDSGVQGCHSGVCGCEETSGLGDFWGMLLFLPFVIAVSLQAILAPAILAAALLLPAVLLISAFATGSFLVLLWAAFTAAVWTGIAIFYQRRERGSSLLLAEDSDE